jgi:coenzyme F420-0:L-glutamate ligase/coenzyme F420-1:gamma-L-glutamate ligase
MGSDFLRDLLSDGQPIEEARRLVARSHERLCQAPVAVLLCMDLSEMDDYPDDARREAERVMAIQSVALAGGNFLLAAHAEGLAGVWVCAPLFTPETARRALELPESWIPQAILYCGYPAAVPAPRPRLPLEQVSVFV